MNYTPGELTQHGLTLRGGNKWPDPTEMEAIKAGLLPEPRFLATTRQRLIKLQALEDSGVTDWVGYESAMDHAQNLARAVDNDTYITEEATPLMTTTCTGIVMPPPPAAPPAAADTPDIAIDDIVQEECAEVIQAISKIRRFGTRNHITGFDNISPLEVEMGQLYASLDRLADAWNLSMDNIIQAANAKMKAIDAWAPFYERNRKPV